MTFCAFSPCLGWLSRKSYCRIQRQALTESNHRTPTPPPPPPPSFSAQPGIQFVVPRSANQSPLPSPERARVRGRWNEQTRLPPARSVAARGDLLSGIAQKVSKEASRCCPPDSFSTRTTLRASGRAKVANKGLEQCASELRAVRLPESLSPPVNVLSRPRR